MNRGTAKLIRRTAKATNKHYRSLKRAFYNLDQKEKHTAREEMRKHFRRS